jgi:AcrR family transcriptional regulator
LEAAAAPRDRILDVAVELLAEYGYDGMSLQMVADRVGLHKSTLFHYFGGKRELADEVFVGVAERLLKQVEPLLASEPPTLEQLLAVADRLLEHFAEERAAARFLMRVMVAHPDDAFRVPVEDESHPIMRLLVCVGSWLERARRARAVRPLVVRHGLINLLGVMLFYPAVVHDIGGGILEADPWSPESLRLRRRELRSFLQGALAPH